MLGHIHSIESFGTVDGPGTRLTVFLQGCPMRCAYCHNPDTWEFGAGEVMNAAQVLEAFERNRPYYKNGGITVTGGEPLAQPEFVAELFARAHAAPKGRIHTCLDTSGATFDPGHPDLVSAVLDRTDLALLDIKHADPEAHLELCGLPADAPRAFADELARRGVPTVIRHVVVPGITDQPEELTALGRLIARWPNVRGLELLPYHTLGRAKYEQLGIPYPLDGVPACDPACISGLRRLVIEAKKTGPLCSDSQGEAEAEA